jgi:energy-converting hydrogenase Eha subunit E
VAWFGLYWGARLGWRPAQEANRYALEPLLVVGLLATDMGRTRSGPVRSVVGLVLATAFVSVVLVLATDGTPASATSSAALLIIGTGILVTPAVVRLRASWRNAVELGLAITDPEPSNPA